MNFREFKQLISESIIISESEIKYTLEKWGHSEYMAVAAKTFTNKATNTKITEGAYGAMFITTDPDKVYEALSQEGTCWADRGTKIYLDEFRHVKIRGDSFIGRDCTLRPPKEGKGKYWIDLLGKAVVKSGTTLTNGTFKE